MPSTRDCTSWHRMPLEKLRRHERLKSHQAEPPRMASKSHQAEPPRMAFEQSCTWPRMALNQSLLLQGDEYHFEEYIYIYIYIYTWLASATPMIQIHALCKTWTCRPNDAANGSMTRRADGPLSSLKRLQDCASYRILLSPQG